MRRWSQFFLRLTGVVVASWTLLMCAQQSSGTQDEWRQGVSDWRALNRADLAALQGMTLQKALESRRPNMLNAHGGVLQVWIADAPFAASELELLETDAVERVEWISESDAYFRFGPRSQGGPALVIALRKGEP